MNYRHAFHAGNFADCMKHALVVALVRRLAVKDTPFRVLDTHAGIGAYDLTGSEAERTGEWKRGVGRLLAIQEGPLAEWLELVRRAGFPPRYPGSPALIRMLLRPRDRLVLCELHEEDSATLRTLFRGDPQTAVHKRDAWEALSALTPFAEKRGLVLVDPPFEQEGEFERMAEALATVAHRFRAGVQAHWYPIKHRAPVRAFHTAIAESGVRDILACELWLREPTDPQRLNGCGLVVVNPPWKFEEEARAILAALLEHLGDGEPGQGFAVSRLAEE
ncbi:23S rRNA (adenine(2030)-N(6))-methyltransferase RlmJ [Pseudoroseomonas cervicalis]|uniref:23S rRNA (adenine(2030)-N(6))-methyltransferase RlmJ n=1 Tax=Teichococcus cervicalis TaxID=204525 RepID=UPI0022F1C79B|nr:23S rRNA (adenine(2030)-N(6))-methyltransferase RlmJ [Pseudoroseomonas cervicalis]WBV44111.1 23S rRNA (adenine(2030)-N(6))-methyltransferase RlmJ [Pseudoroseomonas cervicalis]